MFHADVDVVYCDQFMFGQTVTYPNGTVLSAKKPTGWMSNSKCISDCLHVECDGSHAHGDLFNGRAAQCAAYPPKLVVQVLHGLKKELQKVGRLDAMEAGGPTVEEPPPEAEWQEQYWDESSGVALDPSEGQRGKGLGSRIHA